MSRIRLERLRKEFGDVVAVKGLDLEIGNGRFAALLGPSGCGKTTTMNMISGLEVPTSGQVFFDDRLMNNVPPGKRGVGCVFQNYAIFTHMTVYENIAFGLKIRGCPQDEQRREVGKLAELLQLSHLLDWNAGRLSVNDMQKVALGRSMITEPRIFLLDEPFSNLDAAFRAFMRGELKRIQREVQQTMIYVTHDQVEAMSMADMIAVMDFGVLQQFGTPEEIYNQPRNTFVANCIGSPNMNLLHCAYKVEDGQGFLVKMDGSARVPLEDWRCRLLEERNGDSDLILGIRPEHLHVSPEPTQDVLWQGMGYALEPLGPKSIVHVKLGADVIQVVAPATYRTCVGTQQWMSLDQDYLHIFDSKTGEAIR
jgi:multiple sugar transport system ATP-binding protein